MRPLLAALLLAVLAGCGGHKAATTEARSTPSVASSIRVKLTADSHHPHVGKPWHYEVRVTDAAGRPVPATVHLQIVFGGAAVGQIGRHRVKNGVWKETIGVPGNPPFPAQARGIRLIFQAVANARGHTAKANYWIKVR